MNVAILVFDGVRALDVVGPHDVLARVHHGQVDLVGREAGTVSADVGHLTFAVDAVVDAAPAPDVLIVPGGPGVLELVADPSLVDWVRAAHRSTRITAAIGTGSLLLGAAGLLDGHRATTHWHERAMLADQGATLSHEPVVREGSIITATGTSAGVDLALDIVAEIAGRLEARAIQLDLHHHPAPSPFAGTPERAGAAVVERAISLSPRITARPTP